MNTGGSTEYSTDTPQYLNLRSLWRTDIRQGQGRLFCFVRIVARQRLHVVRYQ
ncbi:hypothetical protein [Xenorhabdus indica]|uniref:hypothetical protein n=1 Tax=Xenorhabdus indica TaxID=333964 RepID=UPI0021D4B0C3|nr:hypothetical protein [Xenorhabdus indica]